MGFYVYKTDDGTVTPWEYMVAADGSYVPGQLLAVVDGELAALAANTNTTPPYVCMAEKSVTEGDPILPVTRLRKGAIYETVLSAAAAAAAVGGKLSVASGGLAAVTGAGTFEIVSLDGKAAGDAVRGRFA